MLTARITERKPSKVSSVLSQRFRSFSVECKVKGISTMGHGKTKKEAKRDAAEKMVQIVNDYIPPAPQATWGHHKTALLTDKYSQQVPQT